jgi:F0F1-type ATP synthase membrane subunit b/b'
LKKRLARKSKKRSKRRKKRLKNLKRSKIRKKKRRILKQLKIKMSKLIPQASPKMSQKHLSQIKVMIKLLKSVMANGLFIGKMDPLQKLS